MSILAEANSAFVYEPKCGGRGGVAGSQPMSTAVYGNPNKLWRSTSIFNFGNYYRYLESSICFVVRKLSVEFSETYLHGQDTVRIIRKKRVRDIITCF
jgi:hypothetical protein